MDGRDAQRAGNAIGYFEQLHSEEPGQKELIRKKLRRLDPLLRKARRLRFLGRQQRRAHLKVAHEKNHVP